MGSICNNIYWAPFTSSVRSITILAAAAASAMSGLFVCLHCCCCVLTLLLLLLLLLSSINYFCFLTMVLLSFDFERNALKMGEYLVRFINWCCATLSSLLFCNVFFTLLLLSAAANYSNYFCFSQWFCFLLIPLYSSFCKMGCSPLIREFNNAEVGFGATAEITTQKRSAAVKKSPWSAQKLVKAATTTQKRSTAVIYRYTWSLRDEKSRSHQFFNRFSETSHLYKEQFKSYWGPARKLATAATTTHKHSIAGKKSTAPVNYRNSSSGQGFY